MNKIILMIIFFGIPVFVYAQDHFPTQEQYEKMDSIHKEKTIDMGVKMLAARLNLVEKYYRLDEDKIKELQLFEKYYQQDEERIKKLQVAFNEQGKMIGDLDYQLSVCMESREK